jgi:hypothetical protein
MELVFMATLELQNNEKATKAEGKSRTNCNYKIIGNS